MQAFENSSSKPRASPRPPRLDLHFELDEPPSRFADATFKLFFYKITKIVKDTTKFVVELIKLIEEIIKFANKIKKRYTKT